MLVLALLACGTPEPPPPVASEEQAPAGKVGASPEQHTAVSMAVGEHYLARGGDCAERLDLRVEELDGGFARVRADQTDEANCGPDVYIFARETDGTWTVVEGSEVPTLEGAEGKLIGLGIPEGLTR